MQLFLAGNSACHNQAKENQQKIEPLANEIKSLQAQLIDSRINGIFAVKEILTPEQFAKFQQMAEKWQKERKGNFRNWREKRMGGGLNKEQSQKEAVK